MKKILLSLAFIAGLSGASFSQLSLNEFYQEPNCGTTGVDQSDWFEIYNGTANTINLDCYRFVVYFRTGTGPSIVQNAYVFDLPNVDVASGGFFVFSGLNTFCYQGGPTHTLGANGYNWNSITGATTDASLKKYVISGGNWVLNTTYQDATDLFDLLAISNGSGAKYNYMLFNGSVAVAGSNDRIENTVLMGYNLTTPPAELTSLPNLTTTILSVGGCNSNGTLSFSSIISNEQVTSASGSDNGFYRLYNGICGTWEKGGPQTAYSPGATNNTSPPPAGSGLFSLSLGTIACAGNTGTYNAQINVSFSSSSPYTITYFVRRDFAPFGSPGNPVPGAEDPQVAQATYDGSGGNTFTITGLLSQQSYFVTAVNQAGCYSTTIYVPGIACSVLPVHFASFTAKRTNSSTVNLVWQTAMELNNTGFEIQRNVNGNWETVIFIPSQAAGGNSDAMLTYYFNDMNSAKGMSQYRIKQIDFDGKSEYSVVRAVRGEGVSIKTVIYPNPSFDGKVNVVFEDASGIRDITLMDMSGRIVRTWTGISNNNLTIDNLNPGMYSLRITVKETGAQTVEKLVVNKR